MSGLFSYRTTKDGRVLISWEGRVVTTLKGERARRFVASVGVANDDGSQLLMARATGNFKRGNERGVGSTEPPGSGGAGSAGAGAGK